MIFTGKHTIPRYLDVVRCWWETLLLEGVSLPSVDRSVEKRQLDLASGRWLCPQGKIGQKAKMDTGQGAVSLRLFGFEYFAS